MEHTEEREAVFDMYFRSTEDNGLAVVSGVREVVRLIEILNRTSEEEKREYFSKIIKEEHFVRLSCKNEIYRRYLCNERGRTCLCQ